MENRRAQKNVGIAVDSDDAQPLRAIILDDLPHVREALKKVIGFAYEGFTFIDFGNGDEACQELLREPPDLFISDFNHPGMGCRELLSRMVAAGNRCPVVIISAVAEYVGSDLIRFYGPASLLDVSVVSKPPLPEDLWSILAGHFGPPDRSPAVSSSGRKQRNLP